MAFAFYTFSSKVTVVIIFCLYLGRKPGLVVTARTTADVQKSVVFANKYNIRITVMSSGDCYLGRSAEDDSLLINVGSMTSVDVKTDAHDISDTGVVAVAGPAVNNAGIHEKVKKLDCSFLFCFSPVYFTFSSRLGIVFFSLFSARCC